MNSITKVSDITNADAAEYLHIDDPSANELTLLNALLSVAKTYICEYTGRKAAELDDFNDFVIVVLVLVQDMYDNRTMYVDKSNLNNVVESILSLHSVNLL